MVEKIKRAQFSAVEIISLTFYQSGMQRGWIFSGQECEESDFYGSQLVPYQITFLSRCNDLVCRYNDLGSRYNTTCIFNMHK